MVGNSVLLHIRSVVRCSDGIVSATCITGTSSTSKSDRDIRSSRRSLQDTGLVTATAPSPGDWEVSEICKEVLGIVSVRRMR